jgi:hypothetical protein
MFGIMRARAWFAGVLCVACGAALTDCRAPTQITIHVTTDAPCGDTSGTLVGTSDRAHESEVTKACAEGDIGTIVFVPGGDKEARVQILVSTALHGQDPAQCDASHVSPGCIVARRALRFLPHEPLRLEVPMRASCAGVTCADPEHETCRLGTCVSDEVDSAQCTGANGCGESTLGTPDGGAPDAFGDAQTAEAGVDAGPISPPHLAAGGFVSCVISPSDGRVRCWGDNSYAQLGNATLQKSNVPVLVPLPPGPVRSIAVGAQHACAALEDGTLYCWGDRSNGKLGDSRTTGTSPPVLVAGVRGVTAVAAGDQHTCALGSGVSCWGFNAPAATKVLTPSPVPIAGTVTQLVAGFAHTCVLAGGAVQCWGSNGAGQLGDGTTTDSQTPITVGSLTAPSQISAGGLNTCALTGGPGSGIMCWGENLQGGLGDGTLTQRPSPVAATELNARALGVAALRSIGEGATCALLGQGATECWGSNYAGQLGDGTTTPRPTPFAVSNLPPAAEIAGGYQHTCALLARGGVRCWGQNLNGQLGDGTINNSLVPVVVSGFP